MKYTHNHRCQAGLAKALALTAAAALVVGCASIGQSDAPTATDSANTELGERQPPANARRFSVIPTLSEIRILTYRDGPAARFGHNHVIASQALSGTVWMTDRHGDGFVRIAMPTTSLVVDEAEKRAQEGDDFASPVPEDAKAGTRENMLSEALLDAGNHAFIRATCGNMTNPPSATIDCLVALAGHSVTLTLPITLTQSDNTLVASGEASVSHDQLGLTAFAALGGALRVAEDMTIRYTITAQQLSGDAN